MHITSMYHININCRDFDVSLAFYQKLGFVVEMPFPEAGNPMVSEGLAPAVHGANSAARAAAMRRGNCSAAAGDSGRCQGIAALSQRPPAGDCHWRPC